MGILDKWFGRGEVATDGANRPPAGVAALRALGHDPTLIGALTREHQALLARYLRIGQLMRAGDYAAIPFELEAFRKLLQAHVRAENARFYAYLEQHLRDDDAGAMRDFRREMNGIAHSAARFAAGYQAPGRLEPPRRAAFSRDYATVGALLARRVKREEASLFPLYRPD